MQGLIDAMVETIMIEIAMVEVVMVEVAMELQWLGSSVS